MPQLDKLAFATQIFWLILLFSSFYFLVLRRVLAAILLNLESRQQALEHLNSLGSSATQQIRAYEQQFNAAHQHVVAAVGNRLNKTQQLLQSYAGYTEAALQSHEVTQAVSEWEIQAMISRKLNRQLA